MATAPALAHITLANDRWDLLAWRYYGDPTLINPIIMANPSVPIDPVLPQGTALIIPLIQQAAAVPVDLPPWGTL